MSQLSARFFSLVQSAEFYRQTHAEAVALLAPGDGRTWFDIGCGPGLVTRLAAARGYAATGFDLDPAMVQCARRDSAHHRTDSGAARSGPAFAVASFEQVSREHGRADVVSAASLLSVLPDRRAALAHLLGTVAPGGTLLIVETSALMASAQPPRRDLAHGARSWVLPLWARVRRGTQAVDVARLVPAGVVVQCHALLGGLVNAWLCRPAVREVNAISAA